jgi:hypothetical protein
LTASAANIALKESGNEQYRIEGAFVVPPSLMQIPLDGNPSAALKRPTLLFKNIF